LGEALAIQLSDFLQTLNWPVDMVTCVPLSRDRLRQRGYNQSAMIARPLAMSIAKPFLPVLLRKTREAPTQVGLSANDRRKNVDGAFEAGGTLLIAKQVLVIDDVTTTGSTMNACARALLDAGAASVYGLTFARAGLHDHISVS
jgi:ComF family protein